MENVTVRHLNKKPLVQIKTLHEGALKCARQVKISIMHVMCVHVL